MRIKTRSDEALWRDLLQIHRSQLKKTIDKMLINLNYTNRIIYKI